MATAIDDLKGYVDRALERFLPGKESPPSPALHEAMRYAVLPGGKRIRPILTFLAAQSLGAPFAAATRPACAIELIHCYSLIHDDLPCMDDDDERRGRPTLHRVFGPALAVLAGDALIPLAFEVVSSEDAVRELGASLAARLTWEIARAAGSAGIVGGQAMEMDVRAAAADGAGDPEKWLSRLAALKTGALFTASARCGALAAGASQEQLAALTSFAENIGLAFQIVDDLLDKDQDRKVKPGRSCAGPPSACWRDPGIPVSFGGLRDAAAVMAQAKALVTAGLEAIECLGPPADALRDLARKLLERAG